MPQTPHFTTFPELDIRYQKTVEVQPAAMFALRKKVRYISLILAMLTKKMVRPGCWEKEKRKKKYLEFDNPYKES